MFDVNGQDSVQQWRAALDKFISSENFGSHIVSSQVIAAAGMYPCLLINSDSWRLSADPDTQVRAEVALTLPMLNEAVTPTYINLWVESAGNTANNMFYLCWKNSPTEQACIQELRNALEDIIADFRISAAQIAAERGERITEKLIA